jgi:NRPS condensation-like uncharacterized protein
MSLIKKKPEQTISSFKIDKELYSKVKFKLKEHNMTLHDLIVAAMNQFLAESKKLK